jgi:hypothetical protein
MKEPVVDHGLIRVLGASGQVLLQFLRKLGLGAVKRSSHAPLHVVPELLDWVQLRVADRQKLDVKPLSSLGVLTGRRTYCKWGQERGGCSFSGGQAGGQQDDTGNWHTFLHTTNTGFKLAKAGCFKASATRSSRFIPATLSPMSIRMAIKPCGCMRPSKMAMVATSLPSGMTRGSYATCTASRSPVFDFCERNRIGVVRPCLLQRQQASSGSSVVPHLRPFRARAHVHLPRRWCGVRKFLVVSADSGGKKTQGTKRHLDVGPLQGSQGRATHLLSKTNQKSTAVNCGATTFNISSVCFTMCSLVQYEPSACTSNTEAKR